MAEAWTEVDSVKALVVRRSRERHATTQSYRQQQRETSARRNVERWFRELPADLAQALVDIGGPAPHVCRDCDGLEFVANDWLLSHGFGLRTPRPTRVATPGEAQLIRALKGCRFPPASAAKRFARQLDETCVTELQMGWLRRLVTKFRRQIRPETLHEADRHLLKKGGQRGL